MKKAFILFLVLASTATIIAVTFIIVRGDGNWSIRLPRTSERTPQETRYYVNVPKVIVNIQGSEDLYCKAGFTLSVNKTGLNYFSKDAAQQVCKARIAELLSLYTYEHLATADGKNRLKEHIKAHLNQTCAPDSVRDVYFTEIIFQ